jgi:hypothetical protein
MRTAPTSTAPTSSPSTIPDIVLFIEPVTREVDLADEIKPLVTHPPPNPGECLLIEDTKLISANQIVPKLGQDVSFDPDFRGDGDLAEA